MYLTPNGEAPSHELCLPVDYGLVCDVIDGLAEVRASVVSPDLKILMTHYTDMLRRNVLGDSDVARLARQIYQKRQRALDLIYDHRPDPKAEIRDFVTKLVHGTERLVFKGKVRSDLLFFRPLEWDETPTFNAGAAIHGYFRFVFHVRPDSLDLYLETSPRDDDIRRRLYRVGRKDESLFNHLEDPETGGYPKLYKRTFLTPRFVQDATDGDREKEIRRH